jgi:Tol biopolymer transport system component
LIASILKEEPRPMRELQPLTPPGLEHIVKACLAKDPDDRPQSAHDLKLEFDWIRESSGISQVAHPAAAIERPSSRRKTLSVILASVVCTALAVGALAFLLRPQPAPAERLEFSIPLQQEMSHMALSADGHMLAFVSPDPVSGANKVSVQHIGSAAASVLPGTDGASYPFWSPDDAYVGFFADGKLKKVAISGGAPQVLATATTGRGGAWGRRGIIVFAPQASGWLWKINADGSNLAQLTEKVFDGTKIISHRWPVFLPDGEHLLFSTLAFNNNSNNQGEGIYLGSLAGGAKLVASFSQSNPGYANGYLFYLDEKKSLRVTALDIAKATASGDSSVVADVVGYQPSIFWGAFSVADNGTVVYNPNVGAVLSIFTWYDRTGKELGTMGDVGILSNPNLSPDDSRVALDGADVKATSVNVWLYDVKHGTNSRFTFDNAEDVGAVWSRDGSLIAYRSLQANDTNVFVKQAQGLQPARSIFSVKDSGHVSDDLAPNSWSLDNKELLCTLQPAEGGSQLVLLSASGGKMTRFLTTKTSESNGQISPDGKWVAYASNESGDWEIYVTTYPTAAGKWQVSRGGGTEPRWRGDSKEIFYIGPGSTLMAVPITSDGTFAAGNPTPLFRTQFRAQVSSTDQFSYDVTKDGQHFVVNRYAKPVQVAPLHIILNATAELRK